MSVSIERSIRDLKLIKKFFSAANESTGKKEKKKKKNEKTKKEKRQVEFTASKFFETSPQASVSLYMWVRDNWRRHNRPHGF